MIPSGLNGATKRYMLSPLWERTSALAALSLQFFAIFSKDSKRLSPTPSLMALANFISSSVYSGAPSSTRLSQSSFAITLLLMRFEQPFTKSISTRVSVIWAAPSAILLTR